MTKPFNTTFILPDGLDIGGVTTWSSGLANHLARIGHQAILVRHVDRYTVSESSLTGNVRMIECNHHIHPNNWYLFKKDIDAYIRSYSQALPSVFIPNYSFGTYAACARLAVASPDKVRIVGMAHTDNAEYYRWLVRFESIIHTFVAVSHEIAQNLALLLPHRQNDIVIRPCGIHVSEKLSRRYTPMGRPLQMIYAGRLSERQKRVSDLIRTAELLDRRGIDFRLRIYGSGRDKQLLNARIQKLADGVRRKVLLAGQLPSTAMAAVYQKADVLLLTSEYEGTSMSMLEGMANGCVPVVTNVSGTQAVINQGKNGYSVPVGDFEKLAGKVLWLAQNRDHLPQLGREAYLTVKDRYSYSDYVPWFSDLLESVRRQADRPWYRHRPFLFHLPLRQFIKEAGYTLAARPGLRWLYRFRKTAGKLIQ